MGHDATNIYPLYVSHFNTRTQPMSSIYSIYKATNTINGKVYIGFDSKWPNRQKIHKRKYKYQNQKFYDAIKKYGWNNFAWELIYQSKDFEHCLKTMEPFFIKEYSSYKNGYNMTFGGEGVIGYKHTPEIRKKISFIQTGKKLSTQHKNNISVSNMGKNKKPMSEQQKIKISNKLKGNVPWNKGIKTGQKSPNCKSIVINNEFYDSKLAAMNKLNLSLYKINKLITNCVALQQ